MSLSAAPLEHISEARWRMVDASRALGVSRTTLWRWMRELDLLSRRPTQS